MGWGGIGPQDKYITLDIAPLFCHSDLIFKFLLQMGTSWPLFQLKKYGDLEPPLPLPLFGVVGPKEFFPPPPLPLENRYSRAGVYKVTGILIFFLLFSGGS